MPKFPGLDSLHRVGGWKEQFERVRRWNERVQRTSPHSRERPFATEQLDDVYAFFMNCYHLRDLLKNSKVIGQDKLDDFFAKNPEMQVCQDICNGLKHFDLSRAKVDPEFIIGRKFEYAAGLLNSPHGRVGLFVMAGRNQYDLYELTETCTRLWNDFLEKNGLA
jgi:hypothetical protein